MIAKVEPLTTARTLRGPFDYRVPGHMTPVDVGSMLVVPFGRRRMLGVVVDLAETSEVPSEQLLEPFTTLEHAVPAELLELGLEVAEHYCSTPARGLALVLPPGTGRGQRPGVRSRSRQVAELTDAGRLALTGAARLGTRQRTVLGALEQGPVEIAALARRSGGSHASVRALEKRGLVRVGVEVRLRRPDVRAVGARMDRAPALTGAQEAALAAIVARIDGPATSDRRLLLHGVTGSGKTEVYLRAVAAVLERGGSAIVLVPEIALTPQAAGRFHERFGDRVALLHSRLGAGERYDEWVRLRTGRARVCVGPRSAIFAPLDDLRLVIVDEEHDASYKQDGEPRYDARWVAERRAARSGAVLVAGSATPRAESYRHLRRLVLPERVDGRRLPPVQVVSMLEARGPLHGESHEALVEVARRGEKAIVMLNRRGWSNFLTCGGCARVWECPRCDVTLVLHRAAGRLACHHCGHGEPVPSACPDCGSVSIARHGAGTERLERELAGIVDPLPVIRLDSDTAAGAGGHIDLLRRFDAAEAGVLVGTQMVAKGHDFPAVTLGIVADADATLRFPDFRAEERTFALVAQLAGRSGRGRRGGRVIVQALEPGARPLAFAAAHDAEGFLDAELIRREALGYPPFGRLVRVVCSCAEPGPERAAATAIRDGVSSRSGGEVTVLGPAKLFRLKGRERAQLLIKAPETSPAVGAVRAAVDAAAREGAHRGVAFSVDVDPV